jgi:uracil-DNA glycosylase
VPSRRGASPAPSQGLLVPDVAPGAGGAVDGRGDDGGVAPGTSDGGPRGSGVDDLARAAQHCRGCELWERATQAVFGEGPVPAPLMFVGEVPGDQEDRQGHPFVGPAGRLLDDALAAADVDRAAAYLTNAVKHFRWEPSDSGKRIHKTPSRGHVTACAPWLTEELARVDPRVVVALGSTAAQAIAGPAIRVTKVRGQLLETPDGRTLVVTTHPSAVVRLRDPDRTVAFDALVADLRVASRALG